MRSLVLIVAAVAVALVSIVWPRSNDTRDQHTTCPFGYGKGDSATDLPAHHPGLGTQPQAVTRFKGHFWTADQQQPWATIVEVDADGIICHVGNTSSGTSATFREVDLTGSYIIPGIVDPHVHLIQAGLHLQRLQLQDSSITSQDIFTERVRQHSRQLGPDEWVLGGGWDDNQWGGVLPDASWIDEVTGGRPACLSRMDGHMILVNSAALQRAGITADTPDPDGGIIDKDGAGQPTGILRESAIGLVQQHIPEPSLEELRAALQRAAAYALSRGVTSVVDMGRALFADAEASWRDLEQVYSPAADAGQMPIRVRAFVPLAQWGRLATKVAAQGKGHSSGRLFWGGVKEFADGSLGSRTALMWEPYSDDPSSTGTRTVDMAQLRERAAKAHAAGLQVAVHAIGDRAVDDVLDVLASLPSVKSPASSSGLDSMLNPLRHRIEHVQHISGADAAARLAGSGVYAVPNPLHLLSDCHMLLQRLGEERAGAGKAFAYQTMLQSGTSMAFGSDWPVVDLEPLLGVFTAVCRKAPSDSDGQDGWTMEEAISAEEALSRHTIEAARLALMDGMVGALKVGMMADMVVLSRNPVQVECEQGDMPQVLQTWLDGRCIHNC